MADSTINGLTALTGANVDNTADQFPVWQNSASTTKKITRTELLTGIPAGTAAAPAISPTGDSNTGVWFSAADQITLVTGGSPRLSVGDTGQLLLNRTGSAGAPTIVNSSDNNTGFYFPAADTLGLVTNGVERLRIFSNQQVVAGNTAGSVSGTILDGAGAGVTPQLQNVLSSGVSAIAAGVADGVRGRRVGIFVDDTNAVAGISTSYSSGGGFPFVFRDPVGERLRIDSAGQVGIGKTPTLGLLDVNADAYFNTVRVGLGGGAVASNTAVGNGAMAATATGTGVVAVGSGCLASLTSGVDNVGVGRNTLFSLTTGTANTAVGRSALNVLSTGSNNTAIGWQALFVNTASDNTAVGYLALTANTSGTNNVAVGRSALAANTTTSQSTAVGRSALALSTAADNTALGWQAGDVLTTGASNTIIGSGADASAATGTGQIVIGKGVTGTANNRITVGITTNIAELDLDGADTSWAASSDERLKQDIATYTAGLDVITALRPVTFRWKAKRDVPTELTNYYADSDEPVHGDASKTYHGFIAQEVKAVLDANPSVPNGQHLWEQRDDGVQTLAPADLVPILVNAIKQLNAEVQALKNK